MLSNSMLSEPVLSESVLSKPVLSKPVLAKLVLSKPVLKQAITFTVVIPLYNKRNTIVATLQSVLAQSRPADEIIVVDDGSSDGGEQLITSHFGERVTLIKQHNAGVSAARNRGISEASSEYIAFLDADDLWSPHYLEEVQQLALRYPDCGLIGTRYQYIDSGGQFSNPKIRFGKRYLQDNDSQATTRQSKALQHSHRHSGILPSYFAIAANGDLPFNASTVTLKKTLLSALKGFPVDEPMGEDQDVWARAALLSDIAYSSKVLGFYNRAADNRACENTPTMRECPFSQRLNTYARHCKDPQLASDIVDYTAAHLRYLAKQNMKAGQLKAASDLLADPRCARQRSKKIWLDSLLLKYKVAEIVRTLPRRSLAMLSKHRLPHHLIQGKGIQL